VHFKDVPPFGFFGSDLHCEPLKFLEILKDYRLALVDSRDIGEMYICSIFETVFWSWAVHNSLTSEIILLLYALGFTGNFSIINGYWWHLMPFILIDLILPIVYTNKYRACLFTLAFIQSFRNSFKEGSMTCEFAYCNIGYILSMIRPGVDYVYWHFFSFCSNPYTSGG
jgi:hypothetical protein